MVTLAFSRKAEEEKKFQDTELIPLCPWNSKLQDKQQGIREII